MMLYRKVDESGYFIEDVLLDSIPVLTETVTDEESGEEYTRNITREVKEETGEVDEDGNPVTITYQENVPDPHYIETPCPEGLYCPKWDFETLEWIEGGSPPVEAPEQEITRLKAELEACDYQVIKCVEYEILGKSLPYNLEALHLCRQTMRDRINELEK